MSSKERILQELQMMTSLVTDDVDYQVYNLLKGGCYFEEIEAKVEAEIKKPLVACAVYINDWFDKIVLEVRDAG